MNYLMQYYFTRHIIENYLHIIYKYKVNTLLNNGEIYRATMSLLNSHYRIKNEY